MGETVQHPLAQARIARGMPLRELVEQIHAAADRRWLRSGLDEARVRKWHRGVKPNGAEAVLRLRALIDDGDFDAYWALHLFREHQRLCPAPDQDDYGLTA